MQNRTVITLIIIGAGLTFYFAYLGLRALLVFLVVLAIIGLIYWYFSTPWRRMGGHLMSRGFEKCTGEYNSIVYVCKQKKLPVTVSADQDIEIVKHGYNFQLPLSGLTDAGRIIVQAEIALKAPVAVLFRHKRPFTFRDEVKIPYAEGFMIRSDDPRGAKTVLTKEVMDKLIVFIQKYNIRDPILTYFPVFLLNKDYFTFHRLSLSTKSGTLDGMIDDLIDIARTIQGKD